jgi:hypothetical protein
LSSDPKGPVDGLNLYYSFRSNPVSLRDRKGTQVIPGDPEGLTVAEATAEVKSIELQHKELDLARQARQVDLDRARATVLRLETDLAAPNPPAGTERRLAEARHVVQARITDTQKIDEQIALLADVKRQLLEGIERTLPPGGGAPPPRRLLARLTEGVRDLANRVRPFRDEAERVIAGGAKIANAVAAIPAPVKKLAVGTLKAAPVVGIAVGVYSAASHASEGDYVSSGFDLVGLIPGFGDAFDVGRTLGETVDEPLGLGETASTWWGDKAADLYIEAGF